MKKNDSTDSTNFSKILTEENDRSGLKNPSSTNDTREKKQDNDEKDADNYVKLLKEKIEKISEDEFPGTKTSPVKHKLVKSQHKDIKEQMTNQPSPEVSEEQETSKFTPSFADKTTQKLEEEIKKSSSSDPKTSSKLRPETPGWHGNSIYILCGPDAGKSFYITGKKVTIGRALDNDVVLKDISVSRKHCEITRIEGKWIVEDLGSDNGTFIDNQPIKKASLKPGQYLQIGRSILILETS